MKEEIWKALFESNGPLPKAPLKKGVFPADIKKIIMNELKYRGFTKVKTKFFFRENDTFYECFQIQKLTARDNYYLHFGVVIKSLDHLYSEMSETYSWHVHGIANLRKPRSPRKDPYTNENSLTPDERQELISSDIDYILTRKFSRWMNFDQLRREINRPSFVSLVTASRSAHEYVESVCGSKKTQ